jgi:hypothetical protein
MLSADVFEPTMASCGAKRSMSAKSWSFRSIRSGAASITISVPSRAPASSVVTASRRSMASASPAATFPSSTPFFTMASMADRPLSRAAAETSYIRVSYPAAIAACAMPCPIVPAPRTVTLLIAMLHSCRQSEVSACDAPNHGHGPRTTAHIQTLTVSPTIASSVSIARSISSSVL